MTVTLSYKALQTPTMSTWPTQALAWGRPRPGVHPPSHLGDEIVGLSRVQDHPVDRLSPR